MRARNIKPGYFKNEVLCSMEPLARLLFAGLWCLSDREGRLEDRPQRIKIEVLPYDEVDMNSLLDALHQHEFIHRYSVDGSNYIEIPKFLDHQNPHHREPESKVPAQGKPRAKPRQAQGKPRSSRADSPSLIPDSNTNDGFELFWKTFPKKRNKGKAETAFKKLAPDNELMNRILFSIQRAKTSAEWMKDNGQFIPYPSTWLNSKGWEDEYPGQSQPGEKPEPVRYVDKDGSIKGWN